MREEADRLLPGLKFTVDLPEDNKDGRCPMLDLKVWTDNNGEDGVCQIRHTFFEKEISAPLVFHSRASHSWRMKIVVLSEEMRRRMRNMDSNHNQEEKLSIIKKFLQKMTDSGYDWKTREEVIKSALVDDSR